MAKQTLVPQPPDWFVGRKELYDVKLDAFGWFSALFLRLPEMPYALDGQKPTKDAAEVWKAFLTITANAPHTWWPYLAHDFRAVSYINPAEIASRSMAARSCETVVVDLNAPDGAILAAFEAWLADARATRAPHPYRPDGRKSAAAQRLDAKIRKRWHEQHFLEVFDLTLWKRLICPDLSDTILSGWIFPSREKGETLDRLRYSRKVLSEIFFLLDMIAYEIPLEHDLEK
jgi:hypothetical protein